VTANSSNIPCPKCAWQSKEIDVGDDPSLKFCVRVGIRPELTDTNSGGRNVVRDPAFYFTMADTEPPVKSLLDKLPAQHVSPLWTAMQAMVPSKPAPKAKVALWKYEELRPLLLEAGQTVSSAEAERRVLMLTNPALGKAWSTLKSKLTSSAEPPFTTDTIFAGLQLINKGETAPAHRHRAFALRFIIEGNGGFSVVDGEKVHMEEGDVVITPPWQWHDHGHEGSGPMIWLDGLDLPLYHKLPTHFAEYQESRYPSVCVGDITVAIQHLTDCV